jgi:hypothetical protein
MKMSPRPRSDANADLADYPGLGRYKDGRYYFRNPFTSIQVPLKTRDKQKAIGLWSLAKALAQKVHGDPCGALLAERLQASNVPLSKGANVHLCDFIDDWRENMLEAGLVKVKIKRGQGEPLGDRTKADYIKYCRMLIATGKARFPISAPRVLMQVRELLSPWIGSPTTYNHLKAVLGRVFDHAVLKGLIERNPMRDIEKLAVAERRVLVPDEAYLKIVDQLKVHHYANQDYDGEWRMRLCDLLYMFSQQPIDAFALRVSQLNLEAGKFGEIDLSRSKTGIAGIIEMNAEFRECVDWLLAWRKEQMRQANVVLLKAKTDNLLIYPAYMDRLHRWQPVTHRTFSKWWLDARRAAGVEEDYWLMDLRKKGLTQEFLTQGENDKGLHDTQRMRDHYRLIVPPKRSQNTLTPIRKTS